MKELFTIQQKLNAPKDKYNSFGKYKYRSCEGILEGLKPLLEETKCTLLLNDAVVEIGGRIYVRAQAQLINESGESICVTAYAREAESKGGMDAAQVTGAASSYARKYALNGLFAIDDAKDPDTDEYQTQNKGNAQPSDRALLYLKGNAKAFEYYQRLYPHNATLEDFSVAELLWIFNDLKTKGVQL